MSRAWHSLAEDEYLWSCLCKAEGYDEGVATVDRVNWKQLARDHMSHKEDLDRNWKVQLIYFEINK